MKNCITLILIVFLSSNFSYSQNFFQPGTIVTNNGDTIEGLIENKSFQSLANSCSFKKEDGSNITIYLPDQLISFWFKDGKHYISRKIETEGLQQMKFLEYLVNGIVDLYYLKDNESGHYYLQKGLDSLMELKNTTAVKTIDDQQHLVERREYIGTMKMAFNDVPQLQGQINSSTLNYENLIRITRKYHNLVCDSMACIVYEKNTKVKKAFGIMAGGGVSNVEFKVHDYYYYSFMDEEVFKPMLAYSAGLFISMNNFFGINENFSFNTQLGYSKREYRSQNIKIDLDYIQIPVYFTYKFPTGHLKPLINAGINNSFALHSKITMDNSAKKNFLEQAIGIYQIRFLLGAGIEFRKNRLGYLIYSNFETGTGITTMFSFLSSRSYVLNISLGVSWSLD